MKLVKKSLLIFLSIASVNALAAGFKVGLESVSDLGNQFAGGSALVDDATINYYNPAGITYFTEPNMSIPFVGVLSKTQFNGTTTAVLPAAPISPFSATGTAKTNSNGIVPSFHYVSPINPSVFFGLSISEPFGLGSKYGKNSILRYASTKAKAAAINIGPSLGLKLGEKISLGVGPDFQYFKLNLENNVRTQPLTSTDGFLKNKATGWGWGWHAGAMFQVTEDTRFGVGYRSRIIQNFGGDNNKSNRILKKKGTSTFKSTGALGNAISNKSNNLRLRFTVPADTWISLFHQFDPKWSGMVTANYTQWHVFDSVTTKNVATPQPDLFVDQTIPENFKNTWHIAMAANYQLDDQWKLRAGIGRDQRPTNKVDANVIIPGAKNYAVSVGARFEQSQEFSWDFAASHAFIKKVQINHADPVAGTTEVGTLRTTGNTLALQLNWRFA